MIITRSENWPAIGRLSSAWEKRIKKREPVNLVRDFKPMPKHPGFSLDFAKRVA